MKSACLNTGLLLGFRLPVGMIRFGTIRSVATIDPATQQVISGDISAQTERVMKNISAILDAAGSDLKNVMRCTVFLKSMDDFAAMNAVYGKYFDFAPPARSTVEVSRLPKDVLVEIDVIAVAE